MNKYKIGMWGFSEDLNLVFQSKDKNRSITINLATRHVSIMDSIESSFSKEILSSSINSLIDIADLIEKYL